MPQYDLKPFPFSAVIGMEDAKKALRCMLVCPQIKTVLIRGTKGTAKTVLARSLPDITGKHLVNIPVNVSEEHLFGGMDIDATVRDGKPAIRKGLIAEADGGILYVDDINLMDQRILMALLNSVLEGRVVLEREGISSEYTADVCLVATMNPEDSDISSHALDRFDLCAYADFPEDKREEILRRNDQFFSDPDHFRELYKQEEDKLSSETGRAVKILPLVEMSEALMSMAVELSVKVAADGYRGDLALINTAKTLAALSGRDEVMKKDVEEDVADVVFVSRPAEQHPACLRCLRCLCRHRACR